MKDDTVEIDLLEIWHIVKKNIVLILAACLLCGTISFCLAKFIMPKKYEAITKIIVVKDETETSNNVTYSDLQVSQKLASTYREIIKSEAISDKVLTNLNLVEKYGFSTSDYNKMVSVSAENNTEVMAIKVETTSPILSADIANEIVDVFISNIYTIYGVQNVSILNRAKVPYEYSSPSVQKYAVLGICVGLLVSAIIIIIKLLADTKIKTEEDIKEIFEYPIIGRIPNFEMENEDLDSESLKKPTDVLVAVNHPDSMAAEAFRILRTNISLRDFDEKLQIINIVSAQQQEAKSTCTLNLGYVYTQLEKKVLVIDLDLRLPSIHEKLRIANRLGVTDVINKICTFKDAVIHYEHNYDVLLSGTKTVYASELIQSNAFKKFLNDLRKSYDVILIDCPPINMVADAVVTSTLTDATIMCIASGHDEKSELVKARDTIKQLGINMIGVVLTRVPVEKRYNDSEYGYGYGYGYSDRSKKEIEKEKQGIEKKVSSKRKPKNLKIRIRIICENIRQLFRKISLKISLIKYEREFKNKD